jgi:hypothetical protein
MSVLADHADLAQIYAQQGERFASLDEMIAWLNDKSVDCRLADSKKGLRKLFEKIEKGEARLLYDPRSHCVFRPARVAKMHVEATLEGERYPLVELCQIFLVEKIAPELLLMDDPARVPEILSNLKVRTAQVRNTTQLWETLFADEDPRAGAIRGLMEELRLTQEQAAMAELVLSAPTLEYEAPIDWPGIHSVLEIHEATAVLPEPISKPVVVEVEAGDQITIFVATPNAPVIRALFRAVIPNIKYVPSGDVNVSKESS